MAQAGMSSSKARGGIRLLGRMRAYRRNFAQWKAKNRDLRLSLDTVRDLCGPVADDRDEIDLGQGIDQQ